MKDEKYYLLLIRFTNLEIKKEDVEDYLEQCEQFGDEPKVLDFLDYLGSINSFDNFNEEIEDTDIEDSSQFYTLIKEIRKND